MPESLRTLFDLFGIMVTLQKRMHKRWQVHSLLALALTMLIVVVGLLESTTMDLSPASSRNILFIVIDDLNTSVGIYNQQVITPAIDMLAATGVRFDAAYTDAVLCNPSRISMITGLRPTSTGIYDNSDSQVEWRQYLDRPAGLAYSYYGSNIGEITTMFEHFAANGYYVANSGKTFHSNEQQNEEVWGRNFSWPSWNGNGWPANAPLHGLQTYYHETNSDWGAVENGLRPDGSGLYFTEDDIPDLRIANNAITIINDLPDQQPFFVSVGFVLPHNPRYVPQRSLDQYSQDEIVLPSVLANDLDDLPSEPVRLISQNGNWYDQTYVFDNPDQWRNAVAAYYASITYVDEQIGRILTALDDEGVLDNTIIVLHSDHGYHLGEKQHLQKNTLWRESARIPLIIREPGGNAGSVVHAPVNSVDLFPTLVQMTGLQMPTDFPRDGRSLVPLLRDSQANWPWPATTFLADYSAGSISRAAIRNADWAWLHYELDGSDGEIQEELYNYENDPYEWYNLRSYLNGDPTIYDDVVTSLETIILGQFVPDAKPVALPATVEVPQFEPVSIELFGHDDNNDPLQYTILELPKQGQLYQSVDGLLIGEIIESAEIIITNEWDKPAYVIYKPHGFWYDSFRFAVTDGRNTSAATITLSNPVPTSSSHMPSVFKNQ